MLLASIKKIKKKVAYYFLFFHLDTLFRTARVFIKKKKVF